MQATDAGDFLLRIADLVRVDRLLRLEHRVDALGRNDRLPLIVKYEGRILPVEYDDIDLFAEHALAVDDMGCRGLIAFREIGLQKFQPDLLAGVALRTGMAEALANSFQLVLDIVMQPGEELTKGTIPSCGGLLKGRRRDNRLSRSPRPAPG